jgi:hypothetical protein
VGEEVTCQVSLDKDFIAPLGMSISA